MAKRVKIKREVIDGLLTYFKNSYPEEGILLLRGKVKGEEILISELVIPPLATHGETFSNFPMFMLPADASILGVAHSHPSGALVPSTEDLTNFYGRVMIIGSYPFESGSDIGVFDREGDMAAYDII